MQTVLLPTVCRNSSSGSSAETLGFLQFIRANHVHDGVTAGNTRFPEYPLEEFLRIFTVPMGFRELEPALRCVTHQSHLQSWSFFFWLPSQFLRPRGVKFRLRLI